VTETISENLWGMEESHPEDWKKVTVVIFHTEILQPKMAGHTLLRL